MTRADRTHPVHGTTERLPRVLSVGPDHRGQGGMATVERQIVENGGTVAEVAAVATHVEGSVALRVGTAARGIAAVLAALARRRVDVLHLHVAKRGSILRKDVLTRAAAVAGVPVVLHCHGGVFADDYRRMPAPLARAVTRMFRRAARVIVLGEYWRDVYVDLVGVDADRVVVARNAVSLPPVVPQRPVGLLRVVFLGKYGAAKGSPDLIRAVAGLPEAVRADVRLVMAGHGDVDGARALVSELGLDDVIEVRGWIGPEERDALLAASTVFVLPSPNEGLPMSMLEAMAWGLVPVVTAVGAIPEVVSDGVNGLFVRPGDVAGITDAVARLALDPALVDRLAVAARATAEEHGMDAYVAGLGEIWRAVRA